MFTFRLIDKEHPGVIATGSTVEILAKMKSYYWIRDFTGKVQWAWPNELSYWRSGENARNVDKLGATVT